MTLKYVILTSLNKSESTGYDISKQFNGKSGVFWKSSHQQVYRELAKMETANLISHYVIKQSGKPDKKIYKIEVEGRHALYRWLEEGKMDIPQTRDAISVRIMAARKKDFPQIIRSIEELSEEITNRLALVHSYQDAIEKSDMSAHDILIGSIMADRIALQYEATLRWVERATLRLVY